ncbi:Protein of unknown function [Pyronema omphalodes CBS 100304]|uniref:Uncharacterized protein n=1 Tax=Pyronema omphalodes (strain CBS 100304) TaxID=1076935 RepID=U4LL83_PYROM|nr:Protein of unknown function [Pyronema omphalodes CBS 100304]
MMSQGFLFFWLSFLQLFAPAMGFSFFGAEQRDASYKDISTRPYIRNDTMPRCIHLLANYTNIANRPDPEKHENMYDASGKAYDLIQTWCGHYKQENNTFIVKDWDKWWNNDDGITKFDREFMKDLEAQGDKDLVFELIDLAHNLGTRPLNVFLWKVLLNMYEDEPADTALWDFLASFELSIQVPTPPEVTDDWLEEVITEVMLPEEHTVNEEMEFLPVLSTFMWEMMMGRSVN